MATNNDDIKWLYGKFKAKGYNVGTEQEFRSSLANEADRKWYYEKANGMGLNMGSMADFNSMYAPQTATQPTPQTATQPPATQPTKTQPTAQSGQSVITAEAAEAAETARAAQEAVEKARRTALQAARLEEPPKPTAPQPERPKTRISLKDWDTENLYVKIGVDDKEYHVTTKEISDAGGWDAWASQFEGVPMQVLMSSPYNRGEEYVDLDKVSERMQKGWRKSGGILTEDELAQIKARESADNQRRELEDRLNKAQNELKALMGERERYYGEKERRIANAKKSGNAWGAFLETMGGNRPGIAGSATRVHPSVSGSSAYAQLDKDITAKTAEVAALKEALEDYDDRIEAERLNKSGAGWVERLGHAVKAGMKRPSTWTMGVYDASVNKAARDADTGAQSGRDLLTSRMWSQELLQKAPMPGILYEVGHFGGEVIGDPSTVLTFGAGGVAETVAKRGVTRAVTKATMKGVKKEAAERLANTWGKRFLVETMGKSANFAVFEGVMNARQQAIDGGWYDSDGEFHEGFSWTQVAKAGGRGAVMGAAMGVFGEGVGQLTDLAVKDTGKAVAATTGKRVNAASAGGYVKAGTRALGYGVGKIGEGTIFAADEIYEFQTMPDDEFDKRYADAYGYAAVSDPQKRAEAREKARNSLSWDAWGKSQLTIAFLNVYGAAKHPKAMIRTAYDRLSELAGRDKREHRTFGERLSMMADRSPRNIRVTKEEREELEAKGYGGLKDLFVKDEVKEKREKPVKPEDAENPDNSEENWNEEMLPAEYAERAEPEELGKKRPELDGYSEMRRLMEDRNVSEATRAKLYFMLTGKTLPMSTVMGYRTVDNEDGTQTVESLNAEGGVVTSRKFAGSSLGLMERRHYKRMLDRQIELNTIDVGERYADKAVRLVVMDEVKDAVAGKHRLPAQAVENIYMKHFRGQKLSDAEMEIVKDVEEMGKGIEEKYGSLTSEAMRAEVNGKYGVDIDKALRKNVFERSSAENEAVEEYGEKLLTNAERQRKANRMFDEEYASMREEAREERRRAWRMQMGGRLIGVDPEIQAEADRAYEESHKLYDRFEQGDPAAQAEMDAIRLRMEEAYQMCEDAFGAEAVYWMYHVNENPWSLVNDPALTPDQQEAVLYYINSKAALDGVMDASNEVADRKRAEVEESVAKRTHKTNGVIIPATMKVDDRPVYIVEGDVVMFPDGTAVDVHNSSESLVVMDAQTGEYQFTSPDQIFKVSEAVNPQDELDTALSVIEQEHMNIFGDNAVAPEESADGEEPQQGEIAPFAQPAEAEAPATADTEEYDRGYECGLNDTKNFDDVKLNAEIENLRAYPNGLTDFGRGLLEAYEYEQQRRQMEAQNAPAYLREYTHSKTGKAIKVKANVGEADKDGVVKVKFDGDVFDKDGNFVEETSGQHITIPRTDIYETEGLQGLDIYNEDGSFSASELRISPNGEVAAETRDGVKVWLKRNPITGEEAKLPSFEKEVQTALSRIPLDKETQEPRFTAVDPETAWDGLVEAMEGEANAVPIAQQMIEDANKRLEALGKKPPTPAKPKLAGKAGPMAMRAEQKRVDEANAKAQAEYQQALADAQAEAQAWSNILRVYTYRNAELRRQQEEERRRRDAEAHDASVTRFEEEQRIKAEKQAEQERIGVHAVNPKIRERWEVAPKVEGNEDALTLPDGSTITGRYVLTEAGAATPSHDPNNAYAPTEGFPIDENGQSVNDRDYQRDKDAQRIVEDIARSYDNRALQDPIIVSKDGVVLSGNNRTMSGDLAARQGTDKAYNDYLSQYGYKKFGFTPEQVQSMKHPRVVFVPDEPLPYDAATFARFNARKEKAQSKPEAAVKLGKTVPDDVFTSIANDISRYDRLSDFYADEKAVAHALGALLQVNVINDKDMPDLRTGTAISAGGKELIENTLIGKVFQASPDAVRQIISVPTLRQSIVMGLSEIANNRTLARNGYDISDELSKAVDLVARAKSAMPDVYTDGMPVSPFGRMQGLFDDEFGDSRVTDATTLLLADILNSGRPSDLRKILTTYNNEASQASGGQMDLFSGSIPTKEEILTTVNEHFRNATPKEQQALVDAAIAERKRRAEADAEQRERSEASEQTSHDDERRAEPQQPVAGDTELEPLGKDRNDFYEDTPEEAALRARISVGEEWEEEGPAPDKPIYKRKLYVDGKHEVIQTDAPDKNGSYTGSRLTFGGRDYGDLKEIADYIDGKTTCPVCGKKHIPNYKEQDVVCPQCNSDLSVFRLIDRLPDDQAPEVLANIEKMEREILGKSDKPDTAEAYTITPTKYEGKHKTSDVWLVKFNRELTAEEKAAFDTFVREPLTEGKKTSRGWYDRKQGGYMMRSEEAARQLGEMLGNEEAVADAQPLSREDIKQAAKPAEKPARKKSAPMPANTATIDEVAQGEPTEQKKVDYKVGDVVELTTGDRFVIRHIRPDGTMHGRYVQSKLHGNDVSGMRHEKIKRVLETSEDKPTDAPAPAEPKSEPAPKGQFKVTDEMKAQEDELRKLLGIDDDEGSTDSYFRDPDELTPEQKRRVFSLGVDYAFNFLDNGVTTFPDFAKAIVGRLGSKVKPFIKSWYEGAKRVPGYGGEGYTDTAEVDRFDIENFDKPSPDAIRDAEMRVAERKAKEAAEQAERELIAERNEQRKKDEQQTATNTAALAEKAEAVASEAEKHASLAGGRKPERKTILRDLKQIDDTLDEVNSQLALLGYYEAEEVDKDFNEAYGYMRNAEKKAVKDAVDLAKQLVNDLGLGLDKVTGSTTANRGKRKNAVTANIAPAGGDISIRLPLNEGRELYITIGLDPSVTPGDVTYSGDNLQATRIMYRVEWPDEKGHVSFDRMGRNCWADANVTYADLLNGIQREAKEYLPSSTPAEEPAKAEPQEEAYHGTVTLKDGREAVVIAANHVHNIGEEPKLTDYIVGVKGEPGTIKIKPDEIAHAGAPTDVTYARLLDTIKKQARWGAPKPTAPAPNEDIFAEAQRKADEYKHEREKKQKNEERPLGEVMDDFYSDKLINEGEVDKMSAEDAATLHLVDVLNPGMTERKPMEARVDLATSLTKVSDDFLRDTLKENADNKVVADIVKAEMKRRGIPEAAPAPESTEAATAKAVETLQRGKKPAKKKAIKPEQQVGDLFGGLFDEPISTTTDEKKTDVQPRPGSAERERGHQPQPNGALGESQRNEIKGTDGRGMGGRDAVNPLPDGERGAGVSRKPASRDPLERLPEAERKNSNNNHAERGTDYAPKGEDARIKANIEAIQLAKQLLEAGEQATPEQMAVLRRFSGWGGLGKAFKDDSPTAHQLLKLLGAEAYETAVMSRNSAYYTPAEVIDTMWDVVRAMGFKGGNVLEGSAGIGNILGLMPADFSERSNIHAIEIDQLTGGILSLLYPDAKVDIQGFEKTKIRNNSVDLAITNVPFVTGLNVMDETGDKDLSKKFRDIHDFCIAKNIRKLREGGIGIFITSSGTMDNSARLRQWITSDGNADVVGAFRMHNKTFGGTGATSDIIVVRKRVNGKPSPNAINIADVTGLRTADYDTGDTRKVAGQEVPIIKSMPMEFNKYFVEHPENMAGEMMFNFERGETWQPTSKSLFPTAGKDQSAMLKEWAGKFADMKPEDEAVSVEDAMTRINERLGEDVKEGSMVLNSKGELCVARMGEAEPIKVNKNKVKGHTKAECFQAYTAIKKALKDVLDYQASHDDDAGLTPLLKELNRAFDSFTRTYGNLHKNTAISFLRNDVDFSSILALETYSEKGDKKGNKVVKVGKTDIFSRRVIENEKEPQPGNIKDGILASLYKSGGVDVKYIADALGKTPDDVRKEIVESGLGFENPATGAMEVSYQYLSGNVRDKLHIAEESNEDGRYDANVKALQRALPMTIPAHLIEFSLGSSWIDHRLYEAFVEEKTGVKVGLTNAGGTWFMKRPWSTFTEKNRAMGVVSKMCGKTIMGDELIEAAITNKTITVSKTERHYDGSTETITDSEATRLCATKVDEIRAEFKDWARARMQTDSNLAETIERTYNEQFNNYVPMAIPEEFVPTHFGGQVSELHGRPFALRPHQSRAVVRAITQPVLLAHEVGTGKTYTLITTAMEMRRLGTARKPMIVVQNATVGQFVESAKEIYPNAKVLTIEEADRTADGRRNFYAKIKYNDWDMIVVPQSVFERIPDSEEREMAYVKSIIEEKMKVLEAMKEADSQGKSMIVRQAEKDLDDSRARLSELTEALQTKRAKRDAKREAKTKQNAEVKALEMLDREVDDVENFDDMGIDAILVDEAHEYKHLGFATAMQRGVKGVDPSSSKKSQGVYLKAQAVLEHNNGRNVVFATGTPISNTAAEIWTFMRYLMPADTMKAYGIYYFDDFVRNFGKISQMVEFTTSGKFKENNRFAGYINLPELVRIWSSVADTVLTREAGGVSDKIPDIEGGKPTDIYLPQTRALRSIMKYVNEQLKKYDKMTGKEKKENSHIPLVMYGIAKAAAVDARLVLADAPDEPNSKTNATVRETLRSLKDSEKYKGTVAIFADNYQNKQSGFNLYEDIRAKLIDQGVPAEQIVIIKSGMTVKKKLDIFEKVNAGEIRVIMGSTFTLGTGVNIQERLHTLIHVDAPNRPMDYTQRNGRGARQGNLHKDMGIPIRIIRFGVEDSLDVTAYQRLKTKGAIADSIMNGSKMMKNSMENRVLEEEEDVFGDMTAQLSGSEYAILKNQAEREVRSLTAKQKQHEVDQIYIHNKLPEVEGFIAGAQRRIEIETANLETIGKHWPDGKIKKITIGKKTFGSLAEMEDFFKEQNAKLAKAAEEMKQGGDNYTSTLPINIDGMEFVVTSSVKPKVTGAGQLSLDLERTVSYSCDALGIKDFSPSGQRLKAVMQDIEQYIVTGERSKGLLSRGESQLAKYTEERTQLEARKGNEFPFSKELAEAKSRLAEYEEAMKKEMAEKEAKYAELDKSVEAASDLSLSEEDSEESDKAMLRPMEEGEPDTEMLESLSDDELVPVFRNVQVLPGMTDLASPMAAKDLATGGYRTIAPRQWNGSYSNVELTEEQQRMYDELAEKGYVMIDGKKRTRFDISPERYFEARATKEPALMFKLDKGVDGIVPASENPYDHGKFNTLNLQFSTGYKRPNLVMVQSVMPKSELRKMMANDEVAEGMYHAPFAKNSTGIVSWTNGDKLALSRWSKIIRILTNQEVAERINSYWQKNPAKSPAESADARDPFNYTPQVLERLQEMGWKFDEDKLARLASRTPEEIEASYQGMPYVTDEDIARLNAKYADERHSSLWDKEPDEFLREAEENTMADKVQQMSERMNTPVRILRTPEEIQAYARNPREAKAKGISRIERGGSRVAEIAILLPNNTDLADVENTFLHEGMGHDGLRLLFPTEKLLNNALDELYNASTDAIKADIDARANRMYDSEVDRIFREKQAAHESVADANANYYTDMAEAHAEANAKREQMKRDATEEYGANVAGKVGEKGFEKMTAEEQTFWGKMKAMLQKAFEALLRGLKIPKMRKWTDKQWAYIYHKAYKMKKANGRMSVIEEAEDITMRRKTGYDADERTMFRDPDMSLEETITKMKAEAMQANAGNLQAKRDAMRAIGGNLNHLRQAMARQREYDITTVKSVTDLAKILMDAGLLDDMSKLETKRILGAVNNVVGKQDVSQYVQKVMDIMVDNQLRNGAGAFGKLLAIRGSRVDARGIEVQGELDPDGQRIAQVVRKSTSLPKDDIDNRIAEAINRMSSTDQAIADEATLEYAGLQIARQYVEDITESKAEEKALRDSIKQAKEDKDAGQMTDDAYKQYVESTNDAIRQNKIERAEAYQSLIEQMGDALSASVERAKAWREAEKQRVEEIHHNANSDMEGRPTDEHHKDDRVQKLSNNSFVRFMLAPLGTFDQMLRMFGKKNVRGEGYLWNRFMRGWVTATEKEYTGYRDALKVLDAKVSEIYGKKMTWGDLFAIDRKLPKASVRFWDGGEMKDHELTQGNLLYIYMADKMSDGRMKLRRMGITEDDIENIKNSLDPKFMQLADWMQEEFLVDKRNEYNEVHKRMFGASMAAIENYFPLKILANARLENVDVADDTTDTALPATSTGSIIKRRRNNLALDVTGANAFSVILDHLQQMERWAAFAEFNRDLNTLLSYKRFRNQVMNMSSVYGAGKTLWNNFRNVCSMAAGAYRPPIAALDKSAVNIAKGVTAAKVSFRVFTALKQFLSMPAYASDSNPLYLAANIANPISAWRWSMENLPLFEKRWRSRMAGDPRLLKSDMDWKMWRSRVVELASRVGMAPNAFVDALTVAIGAHAMYQTKLAKYKRQGYDPDVAEERAKQDATILFNQTQQSSEGAFLSTMQVDRSWLSVLFTVFRNSSMSYTRQLYDSIRNIGRRLTPGYKALSEEFMAKQMRRDGIDPDKADRNAKQEYRRGIIRDLVRVGIFGYVLQLAWNMGAYLPYLFFGDDDDEKDKMWDDVFTHTMFGSIEGLTGGDVYSNTLNAWAKGEKITPWVASKDMPLASDLENIWTKWNTDEVSAMNDVINLLVQSGVGVNPQSLTDAVVAVMDVCGDDAQTSRECALLMARVINCPQSQLDKIYFDELGATGEEASQMTPYEIAERYARYKVRRGAPLTGWAYGNEQREKIMDKYRKKSNTLAKERLTRETDTQESTNMTQWLEEFEATKERVSDIKKVKSRDEDRYYELLDELEATPEFSRYEIIRAYKHDVDELTKEWLNARTAAQRDSCSQAILTLKREMVRELSDTQQ